MKPTSSRITLVTTCMQRLEFLKRSLPTWLEHTSLPIIVVDYSCPEGTGEWIRRSGDFEGRVRVAHHQAEIKDGRALFNPARARNVGATAAETDYLFFIDSDTQVEPGFGEWVEGVLDAMTMLAVVGRPSALFGALGVSAGAFRAVGGYDEGFTGWGGEDIDLRIRLHLHGLRCAPIPPKLLISIPHPNALRARNSADPDFLSAQRLNANYFAEKLQRLTGRTFMEWWADSNVDCLGHQSLQALTQSAREVPRLGVDQVPDHRTP